eukprot:s20_g39.t1
MMLNLILTNVQDMANHHINYDFMAHGPAQPASPVADDAATEAGVEVLDSPADADEFHDALEQMDRQMEQLEQPPESPFSYAPTRPAETVVAESDEPNTNAISTENPLNHDGPNSFVLGKTQDFWSLEDGFLVRNHVIARNTSWRPTWDAIKNMPVKMADLQAQKITVQEGTSTMMVDSVAAAERKINAEAFFGQTLFPLIKEAALKFKRPCINLKKTSCKTNSNFMDNNSPSEVWMAATRPLKKKKNDNEADLRESRMTVEDRFTFLTAKKAEPKKAESSKHVLSLNGLTMAKVAQKLKHGFYLKDIQILICCLEVLKPVLQLWTRLHAKRFYPLGFYKDGNFHAPMWPLLFPKATSKFAACGADSQEMPVMPGHQAWFLDEIAETNLRAGDAPHAWYQVAKRRLEEAGFSQHPLDGCLFRLFDSDGRLCCLVGLHVDDMRISGDRQSDCYLAAKKSLREKFNFKHWTHIKEQEKPDFCGCSFSKTAFGYQLGQPDYFTKVKPITIDPKRRDTSMASQREINALRAVLGALQWPSTQTCPHLGATVSLLSGQITTATTEDLRAANKALKFSKLNNDVGLQFRPMGQMSDMVLVAMSDASWGIRREGHSQGGYLLVLVPKILKGEPTNYIILNCAARMDSLEHTRTLIQGWLNANYTLQYPGEWVIPETTLVVDAKALYDSIKAEAPQLSGDKRTKIEIMVIKEKMEDCNTKLRWISSEMQFNMVTASQNQVLASSFVIAGEPINFNYK